MDIRVRHNFIKQDIIQQIVYVSVINFRNLISFGLGLMNQIDENTTTRIDWSPLTKPTTLGEEIIWMKQFVDLGSLLTSTNDSPKTSFYYIVHLSDL